MGSTAPPINRSLADLQDLLAAAQENWTTTQANLASENATHASTIGPLQVQQGTLNAQIIYFDQQASNGTQMDPAAAASRAATARAALLTCQAAIVSENQRHATAFQEANTANASAVLAVQTYQLQIQELYAAIVVTITPKPSTVAGNAVVDFTATVENDIDGAGVSWSLPGSGTQSGQKGTLSNVTNSSCTYTASPALPPTHGHTGIHGCNCSQFRLLIPRHRTSPSS